MTYKTQEERTGTRGPARHADDGQSSENKGGQGRRRRRRRRRRSGGNNGEQSNNGQQQSQNDQRPSNNRRRRGRGGQSPQQDDNRRHHNHNRQRSRPQSNNKNQQQDQHDRKRYQRAQSAVPLTPFEMFCAYHLGIVENNGYRRSKARDVARRFDVSLQEFQEAMRRFGLERSAIKKCGFDLELAQLDIRVAPDGIDRRELARDPLFTELLELNEVTRSHHDAALKAEEEARKVELAKQQKKDESEDDMDLLDDDEEE